MTPETTAPRARPILALKPEGLAAVQRKKAAEAEAKRQAEARVKAEAIVKRIKAEQTAAAKLRVAQAQALGEQLRTLAPALFDPKTPKPLAIGTDRAVRQRCGATQRQTRVFLSWWTKRKAYQRALLGGGARYALDGAEAGTVTPEHQAAAKKTLAKLHARRSAKPAKRAKKPASSST